MSGIILLMDNHVSILEKYGRLLEEDGYQVVRASTLGEAELILRRRYIHLAVLDICMEEKADGFQDDGGLVLAEQAEYARIPKIILTAHKEFDYARRAMKVALSIVAKDDGPHPFLQAVEQAFTNTIRIKWDLRFHWPSHQPPCFLEILGALNPQPELDELGDRLQELEDLFRKLFYDYDDVLISQVIWNRAGHLALKVFAYTLEREDAYIVVSSSFGDWQAEHATYTQDAPQRLSGGGCALKLNVQTVHYAANAWELIDADVEQVHTFAKFFIEKRERDVDTALEKFLHSTLALWRQQPRQIEKLSPTLFYRQNVGLNPEKLPLDTIRKRLHMLAAECRARQVAKIAFDDERLIVLLPTGYKFTLSNFTPYIYDDKFFTSIPEVCSLSPDGIDIETLLVDNVGNTWLSDFRQIKPVPLSHEFVALETSIRFGLVSVDNLPSVLDFERQIIGAFAPNAHTRIANIEPEHKKVAQAILKIHTLAIHDAGQSHLSYLTGLFFYTIAELIGYDPDHKRTQGDIRRLLYRLLYAALLWEKIMLESNQDHTQPTIYIEPQELKIDTAAHKARIGGKKIDLTPREYDLLHYLHRYAGSTCKKEDIVRDAFGIQQPTSDDLASLLNTNIDRLRDKIEPNPSKPIYVITERGRGFRLITDPQKNKS